MASSSTICLIGETCCLKELTCCWRLSYAACSLSLSGIARILFSLMLSFFIGELCRTGPVVRLSPTTKLCPQANF